MSEGTRGKLVDWLEELHYKYRMFPETIFTVVGLLDRYFAVKAVPLGDLQLVGISALMIAAKFEETYQVPQMRQLLHACAGQYTAA
jgi:cyclin B